jgi:hypothetical protein
VVESQTQTSLPLWNRERGRCKSFSGPEGVFRQAEAAPGLFASQEMEGYGIAPVSAPLQVGLPDLL